nr:MAG TPA: hypothetical protein [Caudoviricetes sp.]
MTKRRPKSEDEACHIVIFDWLSRWSVIRS